MGLSLPKSNLFFLKKCLDKWVHFTLHEINDKKFIEALSKVETAEDYLMLEIPDNEVLRDYIIDGQNNIAMELGFR